VARTIVLVASRLPAVIAALAATLSASGCVDGAIGREGPTAAPDGSPGTPADRPDPREDAGGSSMDGPGDAGTTMPPDAGDDGTVPVFLAQGYAGRTTFSCDLGRTWIGERSASEEPVCKNTDCGHDAGAGRGATFGGGWFFATFGWGPAGSVFRSGDGTTWEAVTEETTYAGLAYGNGILLGGGKWKASLSRDDGGTWESAGVGRTLRVPNARSTHFLPHGDGLFIIAGSKSGEHDLVLSEDGTTWWNPDDLPAGCGGGTFTAGGIELVDDAIVVVGGGVSCRSEDGGHRFTIATIDPEVDRWRSDLVYDGRALSVWAGGRRYASSDGGRSWSPEVLSPEDTDVRVAAFGAGAFVAVSGSYEDQVFLRSEDGVHWERLPADAFHPGHRILHLLFARAEPGTICPRPLGP